MTKGKAFLMFFLGAVLIIAILRSGYNNFFDAGAEVGKVIEVNMDSVRSLKHVKNIEIEQ